MMNADRKTNPPIVGIIGGMGPMATIELFRQVVLATPATRDQEHLHLLIDNNPRIPDRTAAILGEGPDPLAALVSSARRLEDAGASLLIMPCNTAHYWLTPLQAQLQIPVRSMVQATATHISQKQSPPRSIGLLATRGTVVAGLYQRALANHGIAVLLPNEENQGIVSEVIYGVKAGQTGGSQRVESIIDGLAAQGAEGVILGCTELSVLALEQPQRAALYDPLKILAEDVVRSIWGASDLPRTSQRPTP